MFCITMFPESMVCVQRCCHDKVAACQLQNYHISIFVLGCCHWYLDSELWSELTFRYVGMISRSYHDGEHYNSVRRLDDFGIGPAQPITIEVRLLRQLLCEYLNSKAWGDCQVSLKKISPVRTSMNLAKVPETSFCKHCEGQWVLLAMTIGGGVKRTWMGIRVDYKVTSCLGLKADATPTTEPPPPKDKVDDTYADTGESPLQAVMEVTGNTNVDQVQEVSLWFHFINCS